MKEKDHDLAVRTAEIEDLICWSLPSRCGEARVRPRLRLRLAVCDLQLGPDRRLRLPLAQVWLDLSAAMLGALSA